MTALAIRAFGRPAPEGSHELGSGGQVRHSSDYLAAWRRQVAIAALTAVKADGHEPGSLPLFPAPVAVYVHELTLIVTDEQCRAAGTDEPTGRPDVDKLLRATIDGMGDAHLFTDDAQITKIYELGKVRAMPGEHSGATIIISDRPPAGRQGESMTATEYRISLERVISRDEQGFPSVTTVFELTGTAEQVRTAGLATAGALLGAGSVVVDSSAAREQQTELGTEPAAAESGETKRGRGRPRKSAAPAAPSAESVAAEPQAPAVPAAEPVPAPAPQAPAEPVGDTEGETQAMQTIALPGPGGRVNPFAS